MSAFMDYTYTVKTKYM